VTDPIRVGVIGCGEIAQVMHLRFIDDLPDLELAGLCDLSGSVLERLGAKYRVDRLYTTYEELVSDAAIDAVVVATPDHVGPALAALDHGKHVLLEKPAAYCVADATAIAEAASRAPSITMMGYMRVYDPGHELVRGQVQDMTTMRLVRSHNFGGNFEHHTALFPLLRPEPTENVGDRFAETISSGTARILEQTVGPEPAVQRLFWSLLMGSTHDLSIIRDLIGPPQEVIYSHVDGSRLLACVSHARAVCTIEWETASGYEWWDQEITVYGPESACKARFADPYIPYIPTAVTVHNLEQDTSAARHLDVSSEPAFRREWRHFAECIRSGGVPRTTVLGGRQDVELIAELVSRGVPK
jgi:predicted dehydrogenase